MNRPYTYLIGWTRHQKYYYGVRYAKNCDPTDLWTTYFTSSKKVYEFRERHGDPDLIEIRHIFQTAMAARAWEERVLRKMKVVLREDFLNKHDAHAPPIRYGKRPKSVGRKISKKLKGRTISAAHRKKLSVGVKKYYKNKPGPMTNKKHSAEAIRKIKAARALQEYSDITRQKMKDHRTNGRAVGMQDKKHSKKTKNKLSNANKGLRMYNNGKINRKYFPGQEPDGFILGNLIGGKNDQ